MTDFTGLTGVTNDEENHSKPASTTIATQGKRTRVTGNTVEVVKKPKVVIASKKRKTVATPDHGTPQPADGDGEEKEEVFGDTDFRDTTKQFKALDWAVDVFNSDAGLIFTSREKGEILRALLKEQTASQPRNGLSSDSACRAREPEKPEKKKKTVQMRHASTQCDLIPPTTVKTEPAPVDDEPKLSGEQQELIDWVSQHTDNGSLDSRVRRDLLLRRLADEKWADLYCYAKHLTASDTPHDERQTIFTNVVREMKARWSNRPTTLMPRFYDPGAYDVRLHIKTTTYDNGTQSTTVDTGI
ncbi:hypothetical protein LY76DRAFT_646869 [Colletotrichum caudatum]|nr:hypothetical protein LY76DRAFT_646869 [Colletotrichum caudatum]